MNTKIREILEQGRVEGVFAYKTVNGLPFPTLFTRDNMAELEPWQPSMARYPIAKLLLAYARRNPDKRLGILARGCEERAIHELYKWNQLDEDKVFILGQSCPKELAAHCECWKPFPDRLDYGQPAAPVTDSERVKNIETLDMTERLDWWHAHLNRCVRCYGCRDVCPVCFCTECSLEHLELMPKEKLPPDLSFHLVRAIHMGGRCIDCGLCEEVCPARIPLRSLYKEVNQLVEQIFGYKPGADDGKSPFSFLGDELFLPAGPR